MEEDMELAETSKARIFSGTGFFCGLTIKIEV